MFSGQSAFSTSPLGKAILPPRESQVVRAGGAMSVAQVIPHEEPRIVELPGGEERIRSFRRQTIPNGDSLDAVQKDRRSGILRLVTFEAIDHNISRVLQLHRVTEEVGYGLTPCHLQSIDAQPFGMSAVHGRDVMFEDALLRSLRGAEIKIAPV